MKVRNIQKIRKGFIALIILMMILPFNLNNFIDDHLLKQELPKLYTSDVPIDFGETLIGSIDYSGEIDNYTFSANSGDTVVIRMGLVSGSSIDPEIRLYSPVGTSLSIYWGYLAAEITYTLPENGIYKIEAHDHQDLATGTYCIYIQRVNNPGNTTAIEFGDNTYGSINYASEADTYTFLANAGDAILIRMSRISGSAFDQEIRLYSPTGNMLSQDWGSSNAAEIYYALPQSGIFTILACEYDTIHTGSYNLFIQRVNNPGNVTSINLGITISTSIGIPGEADTYTFTANTGENVLIRMSEVSGTSFDPEIRLYSPYGIELSRDWGYDAAELFYSLAQDGLYTILANEYEGLQSGAYSIIVQIVNNPGNGIPIEFGISKFGSIDLPGEADTFTFYGYAGDAILMRMGKVSGVNFDQEIRLYSPSGTELAIAWDTSFAAEIYYALSQNGFYSIVACEYDALDTGSYYIIVQRVNNPGNATYIQSNELGAPIPASIGVPGEADTYTINANAGENVLIRMSEVSGTSFDPEIRLYSPYGIELSRNWGYDAVELSYSLTQDGLYTILAYDHEGLQGGAYCINIQIINNPGNSISLNFGTTLFGSISLPGEIDTYTFSANAEDSILICMGSISGVGFDQELRLYSPAGIELAMSLGTIFAAEIYYTLPQDGVYSIVACEYDGLEVGSYYIFIQRVNNPEGEIFVEFSRRGTSLLGSIDFPSQGDTYTFFGNFGDLVNIIMTEISGTNFDPELILYAPTGLKLTDNWDYSVTSLSYTLPQDGLYTVLAFDWEGHENGAYDLFFQFPDKIYNPSQEPSFSTITYEDNFDVFDGVNLNIRFQILEPKADMAAFKSTLESWGINFYDFHNAHFCWLIEIGDIYQVLDYLETKVPSILTSILRSKLENYLSDDGYARFTITTMSKFGDFGNDLFEELLKFLTKIRLHDISYSMPTELFKLFEGTFRAFFKTLKGSNQHDMILAYKDEFLQANKIDLIAEITFSLFEQINLAVHLLQVDDYSTSASLICEFKSFAEKLERIYDTVMLGYKAILALGQGGLNPLATANFGVRAFTYLLDYYFHYEAGKNGWLDLAYFIADFLDPPVARLDLQIRNSTTNQLLLGHDEDSNTTLYHCNGGFFTGNSESQFALILTDLFPVNVCIVNSHLDLGQPSVYLNQSLYFGETKTSTYSYIFSNLESNQTISTIMDYSIAEGLSYNQLELNVLDQGETWVKVNITDKYGNIVPNPQLKIFFHDESLNANITELIGDIYYISLDVDYIGKEIIITAEKPGYLSNSILVFLNDLIPLETAETSIIEQLLPVLIILPSILGVLVVLEILHKKNLLKLWKRKKG